MHSHHSHSGQFCTHAQGDLESVINEAIRQKFKIFGLSEHVPRYRDVDLYPGEQPLGGLFHLRQLFSSYLVESHRLRSIYSSQIDIIVGLETELITTRDLDEVESILRIHKDQIEYLVGSVHHANEIPIDFDEPTWRTAVESFQAENESSEVTTPPPGEDLDLDDGKVAAYLTSYFDAQLLLMQRLHPEVIGHFDLCRLYRPGLRLDSSISSDIFSRIERNIDYAISYGALFELNAAAFRKGWATSYPGEDILNLILSKNGRLCLSDDSHGPQAVGLNYRRLYDYLKKCGVQELWYLERVDSANISSSDNRNNPTVDRVGDAWSRMVRPKKVQGDWWKDPFWLQLVGEVE